MFIKKIINKLFSNGTGSPVSINDCNIFQELDYQLYLKDHSLLDEYLCNHYEYDYPIKFFSFRKFFKLPRAFKNYMHYMNNFFPEFSIIKSETVLDIGAHHGIFTINLADMGAMVHSFEPNPMNYEILKKNITVNKFFRMPQINNFAVSGLNQMIVDFDLGIRSTSGSINKLKNETLRSGEKIKVKTINFDQYLKTNKIINIKLLKMDCEGAEYDIFESSKSILNIEYLRIEAHEIEGSSPNDLIIKLELNGFEVNKVKANYGAYELYCKKK